MKPEMMALVALMWALFLPMSFLLASGCGGTAETPQETADVISVGQAAVTEVTGFTADDLPTEPGSTFIYMTNIPGTAADVSFDLEGPWNFTTGPTTAALTIALMAPDQAPAQGSFPDASLVAANTWTSSAASANSGTATSTTPANSRTIADPAEGAPGGGLNIYNSNGRIVGQIPARTGSSATDTQYGQSPDTSEAFNGMDGSATVGRSDNGTQAGASGSQYGLAQNQVDGSEYNFQDKDETGWRSFGRLGPEEKLRTYSGGVNVLKFPMNVGDTWTEDYTQTEEGQTLDITAQNTVLAAGRVRVPAGAFNNGLLVQNKVTVTSGRQSTVTWDYIWFVPGIGRVAEVISQPGEKKEVFHSARSVYRLQEYHLP